MKDDLKPIYRTLTSGMDFKVKESILRRVEAMERELDYLRETKDRKLQLLFDRQWTEGKLLVVFLLNSFYQLFVGPLEASARRAPVELGRDIPIAHGGYKFDRDHSKRIRRVSMDFNGLVARLKIDRNWVTKNTARELIHSMARYVRDDFRGHD